MGGNLSLHSIRRAFAEPVRDAWRIDPGYPSTNDVWRIEAHDGPRVLKVSRHASEAGQSCFWRGMETLFGCNPMREIGNQPALSTYLNSHGTIPVPRVLAHETSDNALGSPYVVAEWMPGSAVPYGSPQDAGFRSSAEAVAEIGRHVGRLHSIRHAHVGDFSGTSLLPPEEFPKRLAATMEQLASHGWSADREVKAALPGLLNAARQIPSPEHISPIMPDISPGQFLVDDNRITALVDFESYVWGPVELELTVLELWVRNASAFRAGYEETGEKLPCLETTRAAYRAFIYLLYDAPPKGLARWCDAPVLFG